MTKEQILEKISKNYYDRSGFVPGVNIFLTDPEALAEVLADIYKKLGNKLEFINPNIVHKIIQEM